MGSTFPQRKESCGDLSSQQKDHQLLIGVFFSSSSIADREEGKGRIWGRSPRVPCLTEGHPAYCSLFPLGFRSKNSHHNNVTAHPLPLAHLMFSIACARAGMNLPICVKNLFPLPINGPCLGASLTSLAVWGPVHNSLGNCFPP